MMGEKKVQEILLQAAVLEGDVEVPDGEVVVTQGEKKGCSSSQRVGDPLPSTETYLNINILTTHNKEILPEEQGGVVVVEHLVMFTSHKTFLPLLRQLPSQSKGD